MTHDSPQNHIAIDASAPIAFPSFAPTAPCMIAIAAGTVFPPASLAESVSGIDRIASVSAINNAYPATPDTATERTIPQGAFRRGSDVSSAMCAEASKPV